VNLLDDIEIARESFAYADLLGLDRWDEFTVSTNVTSVGALTAQGRYRLVGRSCQFQASLAATTSVASAEGSSFIKLPITAAGLAGIAAMINDTSSVSVGLCSIQVSTSRCYLPTQAATGNTLKVYGTYEIGG